MRHRFAIEIPRGVHRARVAHVPMVPTEKGLLGWRWVSRGRRQQLLDGESAAPPLSSRTRWSAESGGRDAFDYSHAAKEVGTKEWWRFMLAMGGLKNGFGKHAYHVGC